MPDFSLLSAEEVVAFIDQNFHEFAKDRSPAFPRKILTGLKRGEIIAVQRKEGFAIAFAGKKTPLDDAPADLLFVYVAPGYLKQGIGCSLIDEVRKAVVPGLPLLVQCEGDQRRKYFEKQGFIVEDEWPDMDTFYMTAPPKN